MSARYNGNSAGALSRPIAAHLVDIGACALCFGMLIDAVIGWSGIDIAAQQSISSERRRLVGRGQPRLVLLVPAMPSLRGRWSGDVVEMRRTHESVVPDDRGTTVEQY